MPRLGAPYVHRRTSAGSKRSSSCRPSRSRFRPRSSSSTGWPRSGAAISTCGRRSSLSRVHRTLHHRRPLRDHAGRLTRSTTRRRTPTSSSRNLHYVLFGGSVFGIFAGTYYGFRRSLDGCMTKRLAKAHFWLLLIGFNMASCRSTSSADGHDRRVYTYDRAGFSSSTPHLVDRGARDDDRTPDLPREHVQELAWWPSGGIDPWRADTLRWYTTSPPPSAQLRPGCPTCPATGPSETLRLRLRERPL